MVYDIFHSYGFNKIDDNESLGIKKQLKEGYVPSEYDQAITQIDQDAETLQSKYLEGDKSPSSILESIGYKETSYDEHRYEKQVNDLTFVFDFNSFDYDDGPIVYYVLDANNQIPHGYTSTKMALQEPDVAGWMDEGCDFSDSCEKETQPEDEEKDSDVLTEAFSNLPDWLVRYLSSDKPGAKQAKTIMNNKGIDLANATYTRGAFPRSNRDPVLKDPSRLNIFKLNDKGYETVYVFGVNNPYLHKPGSSHEMRYANELPMKDILEMTVEYGYIDLNDPQNSNKSVRAERAKLKGLGPKRGVGQYPQERKVYDDNYQAIGTETVWLMTKGQDKSGYPLDPTKYVRMLDNVGLDDYSDRIESFYRNIESLRSRLIEVISRFNIKDSNRYKTIGHWSRNVYTDIAKAMDELSRAIDSYQELNEDCARIVTRGKEKSQSDEDISEMLSYEFRYKGSEIRTHLKETSTIINHLEKVEMTNSEEDL